MAELVALSPTATGELGLLRPVGTVPHEDICGALGVIARRPHDDVVAIYRDRVPKIVAAAGIIGYEHGLLCPVLPVAPIDEG